MKALIDPESSVSYISQWNKFLDKYYPTQTVISNSARVCQVEPDDQTFGVADSLFWQDCSNEIIADVYYFDMNNKQFVLVPQSAPYPVEGQPTTNGTQTI